ncbi:5-(carboxyamino)imidazole ribonucleotide synthase [Desulfonatronovibrio magnus]|uniref:5-(carboxyamino)imidazole ribonucleotide synthase n=1 Tax=Desulfonatronovibrio magnus TaxID=698827 RepID=UPI002FC2A30E
MHYSHNMKHLNEHLIRKQHLCPPLRLGIIGGGQLAKMLTMEAKKLGCQVLVLDPAAASPAGQISDHQFVGGFFEKARIRELAEASDVLTYDLENIDTQSLHVLKAEGSVIHPSPSLLEIIQDKLRQKELLTANGLPQAPYARLDTWDESAVRAFGFPLVQKSRRGGYDGRGVVIMRDETDLQFALNTPSILEQCVAVEKEIAVMTACAADGEIRTFPVAEMIFDPRSNALDLLLAPARISDDLAREARALAEKTVRALDGVGVFGVEMFLTTDGRLLVNEVAPRPHNSGHYTIEACLTSQYGQHLRAIAGLPLGSTEQHTPAAMVNLVGEPGAMGRPLIQGLAQALALPGVSVHIYGKHEVRPFRKMGHAVVLDADPQQALSRARHLKNILRIYGENSEEQS